MAFALHDVVGKVMLLAGRKPQRGDLFSHRTTEVSLQILDSSHQTVSDVDDFPGVLRQIVFVHGSVFNRARTTTNLTEFLLDAIEVCRHA
jgi:hypothetical protein